MAEREMAMPAGSPGSNAAATTSVLKTTHMTLKSFDVILSLLLRETLCWSGLVSVSVYGFGSVIAFGRG
jgi:hypothetical protein